MDTDDVREQPEGMPNTFMPPPRAEHVTEAKAIKEYIGTAQPLRCANCGEVSTNPGQFVKDGRWVCTQACRRELCDWQSYDNLAASGGIVDAP